MVTRLLAVVAAVAVAVVRQAPATAASLSLDPRSGPVGTAFVATGSGFEGCAAWYVRWDHPPVESDHDASRENERSVRLVVPVGAAVGDHKVTAWCDGGQGPFSVTVATFTVTQPPAATTTTPRPTVGRSIPTAPPAPAAGTTPTTTPPVAPTTTRLSPPTSSRTTPTTTVATTTLPPEPSTTTSRPSSSERVLLLNTSSADPGSSLTAAGRGCAPGSAVTLSVLDREVGVATADGEGRFTAAVDLPDLEVGRYQVVARCDVVLSAGVDVVLASQVDAGTSTLAILLFFLLVGLGAVRRQLPRRVSSSGKRSAV